MELNVGIGDLVIIIGSSNIAPGRTGRVIEFYGDLVSGPTDTVISENLWIVAFDKPVKLQRTKNNEPIYTKRANIKDSALRKLAGFDTELIIRSEISHVRF